MIEIQCSRVYYASKSYNAMPSVAIMESKMRTKLAFCNKTCLRFPFITILFLA